MCVIIYYIIMMRYEYYLFAECIVCVHYYDAHADIRETLLTRTSQRKLMSNSNTCMCSETPVVWDHHQVNTLLLHILGQ